MTLSQQYSTRTLELCRPWDISKSLHRLRTQQIWRLVIAMAREKQWLNRSWSYRLFRPTAYITVLHRHPQFSTIQVYYKLHAGNFLLDAVCSGNGVNSIYKPHIVVLFASNAV